MSPRARAARTGVAPGPSGPDPARLAGLLARVWSEVACGRRPLSQIAPLVAPALLRRLSAQLPRAGARGATPPVNVGRIHTCTPAPGVCEASVVIVRGDRTSAIAVRLERHQGAWRAVELTAPEAGLPALRTASRPHPGRPRDTFDEVLESRAEQVPRQQPVTGARAADGRTAMRTPPPVRAGEPV